jgi:hypothetical protein
MTQEDIADIRATAARLVAEAYEVGYAQAERDILAIFGCAVWIVVVIVAMVSLWSMVR